MSQKLPVKNFDWIEETSQFNNDFIKIYNEKGDEGYFLEDDIQYLKKFHEFCNDLPLSHGRMKIEKFEKLAAILYEKTECLKYIRNLKQVLNHELVFKKFITTI